MAWKKILFSGSAAELHSVTATNAITASSFFGDGSQLSNITVSQAATVASEFTSQTSVAVDHNFDSKNVTVTVYNDSDVLILPASVTLTNLNTATVTFDSSTSGHIVVAKGGHVVSGSVNASDITGLAAAIAAEIPDNTISASVLSSPSQGTARLTTNGVAADVDLGLQSGDSPTFVGLTLTGNLEVQGTTTTVDSTTVQFADNIIALSILWDGANNKWVAGASGSEKTVALLDGQGLISSSIQVNADSVTNFDTNVKAKLNADNVLSSSAQIASDISGSFGIASASFAADILTNASAIAGISTSFTLSADSGTNDSFSSGETLTFAGGNGIDTVVTNGNIAINGVDGLISSSAQVNANTITNFDANVKTKLDGDGVISGSSLSSAAQGTVTLTTNGVAANVDTGLQTGDTPTFAGLTIAGDLTVTGNTFEAQVTNLNVEDKFITVNSGSSSGESGLVFGGADPAGSGNANSGSAIFWDSTNVFGFAQDVAASATSATLTSKLGNIETHANANPSAAPTFQGKGTIYVNEDSQGIFIYS